MTTPRRSRENPEVREFILRNASEHPKDISALAVQKFGLSRAAISGYMQRLIRAGLVTATGRTFARQYSLKKLSAIAKKLKITAHSSEDTVWRFRILPHLKPIPENVRDICQYGFTEMFNNVIDHSASPDVIVAFEQDYAEIRMRVIDHGVGIFEKIRRDFHLPDPRTAMLELSKGKLTSDTARHSGEGIFFTSRMFDKFRISANSLFYGREKKDESEWWIEGQVPPELRGGTEVFMAISTDASWTMRQIFEKYEGDDVHFRKTHVPIKLGRYPGEQLVSRSQAKRILARFENFSEVILDFEGVPQIGQAFADEIFRVFRQDHPNIRLFAIRTNPEVTQMIERVQKPAISMD